MALDKADYVKGLRAKFVIQRGRSGKQNTLSTCGCCLMEQNCYAVAAWRRFFKTEKDIKRVIELGTGRGGWSYVLNEECKKYDIEFRTFELYPEKCEACEKHGFVCELIPPDLFGFNPDGQDRLAESAGNQPMKEIVAEEGRTVLLVDSAYRMEVIEYLFEYMKPNDIVATHDYARTAPFGQRIMRAQNIWRSNGMQLKHFTRLNLPLDEYRPMLFWRAAWGVFLVNK